MKAQSCEAQSSYVSSLIAQIIDIVERGKGIKLASNRELNSVALVYRLIHAAYRLIDIRVELRMPERKMRNGGFAIRIDQALPSRGRTSRASHCSLSTLNGML